MPGPAEKTITPDPAASAAGPAHEPGEGWSERDLIDPHGHTEKASKVRGMFAAIAGSYDLNNRLHSLGHDQAWRRAAVRAAVIQPGETVLDIACGTGDLTEAFARSPAGRVIGVDFTPEMLAIAGRKLGRIPEQIRGKVSYQEGDAQALAFPDASADVVSIAFGIRNVAEPARAIREFARVLRPGGRLVILEFGTPKFPPARWLNNFYCGWIMPRTATLIAGDRSGAYKYLPKSVGTFLSREQLCGLMEASGLEGVRARGLTMGICVCYRAQKPPVR